MVSQGMAILMLALATALNATIVFHGVLVKKPATLLGFNFFVAIVCFLATINKIVNG